MSPSPPLSVLGDLATPPPPRPLPGQPYAFTPYSATLGGVVRELHRSLLLALAAEHHHTTLTLAIKVRPRPWLCPPATPPPCSALPYW